MTWAEQSIKAIEEVIADHPELDRRSPEMRKLVSDAYPFGDRSMFPYKAWLKAMDSCLGPSEKKKAAQAKPGPCFGLVADDFAALAAARALQTLDKIDELKAARGGQ